MARDCTHGQKCYNCKLVPLYDYILAFFLASHAYRDNTGGEVGHVSRDCPTEAKGERVCYNCKQPGHIQSACPNN